jgi:hypothetical protein
MHTISIEEYMKWGQKLSWATQEHYKLLLGGHCERHRRTEQILPRLVKRGKLVSRRWGKKLAYAVPRIKNSPLEHGLGCTETLVRTWLSDPEGSIIQEKDFRGLGSVADWGIKYSESLLLCEFSTENNFDGARIIKTKISKYIQNLWKIREKYKVQEIGVLFVIDVPRERVFSFTKRHAPPREFFFIDYASFRNVPIVNQLTEWIYFWMDGQEGPVREKTCLI